MEKEKCEELIGKLSEIRNAINNSRRLTKNTKDKNVIKRAKYDSEVNALKGRNLIESDEELREVFLSGKDPVSRAESLRDLINPDYCENDIALLIEKIKTLS